MLKLPWRAVLLVLFLWSLCFYTEQWHSSSGSRRYLLWAYLCKQAFWTFFFCCNNVFVCCCITSASVDGSSVVLIFWPFVMFFIRHVLDGNWKVLAKNSSYYSLPHCYVFTKGFDVPSVSESEFILFLYKRFWYVLGLTYAEMRKWIIASAGFCG